MIRNLKVILSLCVAAMCLVYAGQNLANLDQAYGAVAYVMGNVDHQVYPNSFGPTITSPALLWVALIIIIGLEITAGLVTLKGTWDLFQARSADAATFDRAKRVTLIGVGLTLLVWFGLFHVIGGAVFQQWQTEAGDGSLTGAFWYCAMPMLVGLYLTQMPDD
ncbi:MAG: DUF2165 family protein [Xanthomonadales bacterium]|nr:DUF2165 domain-containing protein [Xanthomonadales bacterium]NIX13400.1 DUF2165 family protein [Xanthomonadales bacterium]